MSLPKFDQVKPKFDQVKLNYVFQGNNNKVFKVTKVNDDEIEFNGGPKMDNDGNPHPDSGFIVYEPQWYYWLEKKVTKKVGGKKSKTRKQKSIKRKGGKRSKTSRRR
jgi:hypothetical protein